MFVIIFDFFWSAGNNQDRDPDRCRGLSCQDKISGCAVAGGSTCVGAGCDTPYVWMDDLMCRQQCGICIR